jgi:DNA-binding transcriptional ArsR family regulator
MTEDGPVYKQKSIQIGDINELLYALEDPVRLNILRSLAVKNHLVENVDFICGVLKYKTQSEAMVVNSSSVASDEMKVR